MARHLIARVVNDQFIPLDASGSELPEITVGTDAWYTWLNACESQSFAYHTASGALTARRELRHGCWYWYAYRAQHGKLGKVYLGKAEELSSQRLAEALKKLTLPRTLPADGRNTGDDLPILEQPMVLLTTKRAIPSPPPHLVTRPRLLQVLQQGAVRSLTLVCAPAGFGKTTLLGEWAIARGRSVAWLSLDEEDNDPRRFLAYLIGALQKPHPVLGSTIRNTCSLASQDSLTEAMMVLLNELATLPTAVTIILDNYHVIEHEAIHAALKMALDHLPAHVHLMIASRHEPPFPLARLRASGKLIELSAAALRFTHEEVETWFTSAVERALGPAEITILRQRTEGWIAGLQLAAVALQEEDNLARFVASFAGNHQYVLAYLLEEILEPQPAYIRSFLLHTSILESLNSSLCCAVADQEDAQSVLEYLERANLFLFPQAEQGGWYRYHQLFAEALRHQLERTQPELVPILHARASQWFEARGCPKDAIRHSLEARDFERAAGLIEQAAEGFIRIGEITTLQHWLAALPNAVVRASPRLCITAAWLSFITSEVALFFSWVDAAEQALQVRQETLPLATAVALQGEIAALRAIYALSSNDVASAIATCRQALQHLPTESLYPRSLVLLILGIAYSRGGSVSAGTKAIMEASSRLQVTGHALLYPYGLALQAELFMAQGSTSQAAKIYQQVLTLAPEQDVPSLLATGAAHVGLSYLFWEWNNLDAARQHLLQAWDRGLQIQSGNILSNSALLLALVSQAQGNREAADLWLQQTEIICQKAGHVESLAAVAAGRARLSLAAGRMEEALIWMRGRADFLEDPNNTRSEFEQLTLARVLIAVGRVGADESAVQRARALLERLRAAAEAAGRVRSLLEALALQALALQLQGDNAGALAALGRAVSLAEPGRYIRLFLGEGEPMSRLLRQLLEQYRTQKTTGQKLSRVYLSNLLKVFAHPETSSLPTSPTQVQPLFDPLSWREREVLRLMASGRKNREIAEELVVVTGTVKSHINTIYAKLGVTNRVQAVAYAHTLGLL
ncbi:MAG TPA: LuxR C-terminal-related transcriptional regulator [Ktedonobacterales bacterium]|jgi:LuxR family maltose regulon positive regulatory protein